MVSLKRTPAELKEQTDPVEYNPDVYPVSLYLSDEEVEKLKLEEAKVGDEMEMVAKVRVSSFTQRSTKEDKSHYNATLEFMEAEVKKPSGKSKAEKLFGE